MSLNHSIVRMCQSNKDGSHQTQRDRMKSLSMSGKQLREMGFKLQKIDNLKPKHVEKLVERWQSEGLSTGTMKNRLSHLRWTAEKIGKEGIVERDNRAYGIDDRKFVDPERAREKVEGYQRGDINKITDQNVRTSLELQRKFGLRREEAMKIQPGKADQGDRLVLDGSWTKGGKEREIPIRTESQRAALEQAKQMANGHSLIPIERSYAEHKSVWESQTSAAGFEGTHGARYEYAQSRYEELTGRLSPACGGPVRSELSPDLKAHDMTSRELISREMGHERGQITAVYLGG